MNVEFAQHVIATDEDGRPLPAWFMVEIARDLPRSRRAVVSRKQPKRQDPRRAQLASWATAHRRPATRCSGR